MVQCLKEPAGRIEENFQLVIWFAQYYNVKYSIIMITDGKTTYNENSIGIFLLGNYSTNKTVSNDQTDAIMTLIDQGIRDDKIHKDYVIYNIYQLEGGIRSFDILQIDTGKLNNFMEGKRIQNPSMENQSASNTCLFSGIKVYSRSDWRSGISHITHRLKDRKTVVISHIPDAECNDEVFALVREFKGKNYFLKIF